MIDPLKNTAVPAPRLDAAPTDRPPDRGVAQQAQTPSTPLAQGLRRHKQAPDPKAAQASQMRSVAGEFWKQAEGKEPVTAAGYAALTGIDISPTQASELDQEVKATAARIGLDHEVGFATEIKYLGYLFPYAFLGTFEGHKRPSQPILLGAGLEATTPDDVELLYKHFNDGPLPAELKPWLEDFIALDRPDRIEAVLVHEKLELDAINMGDRRAHHTAVENAPFTDMKISPRVRRHLKLYAECSARVFGGR